MGSFLKGKRYIGGIGGAVTLMAILCAWFVYAGEIETNINAVAEQISTLSNGKFPIDQASIALETQVANSVEQQLNNGISAGMYSVGPLASDPAATRSANILTSHFGSFCGSPPESSPGNGCPTDPLLMFGDTKLSTILTGTSYQPARITAINQFLYNLIPIPTNNLAPFVTDGKVNISKFPTSLPKDDPNSQTYSNPEKSFASMLSDQALLSIPRQSFAEMVAKRTPSQSGGDSMMQIMERVAMQRFMSTAWSQTLPTMEAKNLLQEIALMQSYHIWLEYERYRQMERIEALLSAMVIQNYNSGQAAAAVISSSPGSAAMNAPAASTPSQ